MKQESKKKSLSDYSIEELNKLSFNEVQQMYIETLKEISELSKSVTRTIDKLDEYRKKAEQSGDGKTARELGQTIDSAENQLDDKLSACCGIIEDIKKRHDPRYEDVIQEAGEIEPPANKLRH